MEFRKIKEIIGNVLSISPESLTDKTRLTEDLGADSLELFEILLLLEKTFDIEINPESFSQAQTVGDIKAYVATDHA